MATKPARKMRNPTAREATNRARPTPAQLRSALRLVDAMARFDATEKHGLDTVVNLLQHPKIDFFKKPEAHQLRVCFPTMRAIDNYGPEAVMGFLDHPKLTATSVPEFMEALQVIGPKNMRKVLLRKEVNKGNLAHYSGKARLAWLKSGRGGAHATK